VYILRFNAAAIDDDDNDDDRYVSVHVRAQRRPSLDTLIITRITSIIIFVARRKNTIASQAY